MGLEKYSTDSAYLRLEYELSDLVKRKSISKGPTPTDIHLLIKMRYFDFSELFLAYKNSYHNFLKNKSRLFMKELRLSGIPLSLFKSLRINTSWSDELLFIH